MKPLTIEQKNEILNWARINGMSTEGDYKWQQPCRYTLHRFGEFLKANTEEPKEKLKQEALGWIRVNKIAPDWNLADILEAEEIILKLIAALKGELNG